MLTWTGPAIGAVKGCNIITGMFVAELHNMYKDSATSVLPAPVPALLIIVGVFLAGYPQDAQHLAPWSHTMQKMMRSITVKDADIRRYWDHVGASTVLIGIFFSSRARRVLTSPVFNFLGRVSFPVYLIHNTMIKSVLTWMLYLPSAMNPPKNEKGEQMDLQRGSTLHVCIAILIYFYLLYRAASLWTQHIDPVCAKLVNAFTKWATGEPPANTNGGPIMRKGSMEKSVLPA